MKHGKCGPFLLYLRFKEVSNLCFILTAQITKAMDISVIPSPPGSRFPYKLEIKGSYTVLPLRPFLNFLLADKHVLSEDEKKTQEYATHNLGPIVSANITDYKIRQISIPLRVIRGHSLSRRVHNLLAAL